VNKRHNSLSKETGEISTSATQCKSFLWWRPWLFLKLLESTIIDQLTFQLIWSIQVADTDLFTAVTW